MPIRAASGVMLESWAKRSVAACDGLAIAASALSMMLRSSGFELLRTEPFESAWFAQVE